MKEIKLFNRALEEKGRNLKELGINQTLFCAYCTSLEAGNEQIDFSEVIWDYDIEDICRTLKENAITGFTISSTFSSLIATLAEFEKHDFRMAGLTEVNSRYTDFLTGEHKRVPAIQMAYAG